jgi:pilus assembly protein CpaC
LSGSSLRRRSAAALVALAAAVLSAAPVAAQTPDQQILRVDLPIGRSYPIETPTAISRVSVANPEIADVAVIGERDVVINARAAGETDVILWVTGAARRHYRVQVRGSADRMQVVLGVKFAEVRKNLLTELGVSGLGRSTGSNGSIRGGTGNFSTDDNFDPETGAWSIPGRFLTVFGISDDGDLLGLIDVEATRGNARILAEPNLMAANKEEASFLAGGEVPIPVVQGGTQGSQTAVSIQYREYGVRLRFTPEILNDSLVKLKVAPEVSSLDFGNAVLLSGFRIPALLTRRMETTVDVRRNQSLVISGLFNSERETARTGIPFLMDIPILGNLFSSTRWLSNETELVVIVTPILVDPNRPRAQDLVPIRPNPALPAREALEDRGRLQPAGTPTTPVTPTPRTPTPTRPPR